MHTDYRTAACRGGSALLLLLLLSACEAIENREVRSFPTDAELEQYNASVPPEERIVCREEKPLGSRISQRVCRRAGEIDETADLTQGQFRRIIR